MEFLRSSFIDDSKVVPSLENLVINHQQVILQIWLSAFEKVINHQQVILQMWLSAFETIHTRYYSE